MSNLIVLPQPNTAPEQDMAKQWSPPQATKAIGTPANAVIF